MCLTLFVCLVTQSCLTLCNPMDSSPPGSSIHGDSPGKNTGVGCHAFLQGIFPTQGLNLHLFYLLLWQAGCLWLLIPVSVRFSHSVVSDPLQPHGLQHARPPCASPSPGARSNSCPLSQWCHPTVSSSVIPCPSCPQSFPASGSCPMTQHFASGGQSIGVSASASVLPMNTQDWFPLGWTGWISSLPRGLSRVFSNPTVGRHQFFGTQPSLWSSSHIRTWPLFLLTLMMGLSAMGAGAGCGIISLNQNQTCPHLVNSEVGRGWDCPFLISIHKSFPCRFNTPRNIHYPSPSLWLPLVPKSTRAVRCMHSGCGSGPCALFEYEVGVPQLTAPPKPALIWTPGWSGCRNRGCSTPFPFNPLGRLSAGLLVTLTPNLTMTKNSGAILNFIILICQAWHLITALSNP